MRVRDPNDREKASVQEFYHLHLYTSGTVI